jgi:hypothetical protein
MQCENAVGLGDLAELILHSASILNQIEVFQTGFAPRTVSGQAERHVWPRFTTSMRSPTPHLFSGE